MLTGRETLTDYNYGTWKIHVAVHSCWKKKNDQLNLQNSDSVI